MGKSSPSVPAAPDPVATANAQSAADVETAKAQAALNRINQVTPYGTLTYSATATPQYDTASYDKALKSYNDAMQQYYNSAGTSNRGDQSNIYANMGGERRTTRQAPVAPTLEQFKLSNADIPQYTQTTTFSPEQQALYDLNQKFNVQSGNIANEQLGRLSTALSQPISYEGAPALMNAADQATQNRAEEALMARLNPQFDRDRAALESRLASQGIALGSGAYNTAMGQLGQNVNDARSQAALNAISLAQSNAALQNQARQQYVQEAASIRNQPLNEISALISGTQVSSPTFSGYSNVSLPQSTLADNIYNSYAAKQNAYNQQVGSNNAAMGGLFGLGGSALGAIGQAGGFAAMFSDKRLKKDIKRIGKFKGFNFYRYKYIWDDFTIYLGFMAQEVEKTRPDAVIEINGWKAINYGVL